MRRIAIISISFLIKALQFLKSKIKIQPKITNESIQYSRVKKWIDDNGEMTLRLNYNLNENSTVFDLGGYEGQWASDIYSKYNCSVYIFEPYLPFAKKIKDRFEFNNKMKVFDFGLGAKNEKLPFANLDNSSSMINAKSLNSNEYIEIKSVSDFLNSNSIESVDLVKINIEGAEYELLETILVEGKIKLFKNLQIQFHDFLFENSLERMKKIQEELSKTHRLTYYYEYVWENWELKN